MVESTAQSGENRTDGRQSGELSKLVDWITAGVLVLSGLFTTTVGVALYTLVDRAEITDLVADGTIDSPQLTDAELVDLSVALSTWGGVGVTVTGLLLIGTGVAFLYYRKRLHQRETGDLPDTVTLAIVGAVVTGVTSFVPLSPILGGLTAGYLNGGERWAGARVGAYAGALAAVPVVLFLTFLLGGLVITSVEIGLGGIGAVMMLTIVFSVLFTVGVLVGLSALGGYIGSWLWVQRNGESTTAV